MSFAPTPDLIAGLVLVAVAGPVAFALRLVSRSGLLGGLAVGTLVVLPLGGRGFVVLAVFFALGSGATRVRYRAKEAEGVAERGGGRRGGRSTLANGACAAASAVTLLLWPAAAPWLVLAFVGSLATALADTLGTEIGQAFGSEPVRITTLRRVERGTEGGVSLVGTLAGLVGAAAIGATGAATGLHVWAAVPAVAAAGLLGSAVESLVAAMRPGRRIDGDLMNVLNTAVGATLAVLLGGMLS